MKLLCALYVCMALTCAIGVRRGGRSVSHEQQENLIEAVQDKTGTNIKFYSDGKYYQLPVSKFLDKVVEISLKAQMADLYKRTDNPGVHREHVKTSVEKDSVERGKPEGRILPEGKGKPDSRSLPYNSYNSHVVGNNGLGVYGRPTPTDGPGHNKYEKQHVGGSYYANQGGQHVIPTNKPSFKPSIQRQIEEVQQYANPHIYGTVQNKGVATNNQQVSYEAQDDSYATYNPHSPQEHYQPSAAYPAPSTGYDRHAQQEVNAGYGASAAINKYDAIITSTSGSGNRKLPGSQQAHDLRGHSLDSDYVSTKYRNPTSKSYQQSSYHSSSSDVVSKSHSQPSGQAYSGSNNLHSSHAHKVPIPQPSGGDLYHNPTKYSQPHSNNFEPKPSYTEHKYGTPSNSYSKPTSPRRSKSHTYDSGPEHTHYTYSSDKSAEDTNKKITSALAKLLLERLSNSKETSGYSLAHQNPILALLSKADSDSDKSPVIKIVNQKIIIPSYPIPIPVVSAKKSTEHYVKNTNSDEYYEEAHGDGYYSDKHHAADIHHHDTSHSHSNAHSPLSPYEISKRNSRNSYSSQDGHSVSRGNIVHTSGPITPRGIKHTKQNRYSPPSHHSAKKVYHSVPKIIAQDPYVEHPVKTAAPYHPPIHQSTQGAVYQSKSKIPYGHDIPHNVKASGFSSGPSEYSSKPKAPYGDPYEHTHKNVGGNSYVPTGTLVTNDPKDPIVVYTEIDPHKLSSIDGSYSVKQDNHGNHPTIVDNSGYHDPHTASHNHHPSSHGNQGSVVYSSHPSPSHPSNKHSSPYPAGVAHKVVPHPAPHVKTAHPAIDPYRGTGSHPGPHAAHAGNAGGGHYGSGPHGGHVDGHYGNGRHAGHAGGHVGGDIHQDNEYQGDNIEITIDHRSATRAEYGGDEPVVSIKELFDDDVSHGQKVRGQHSAGHRGSSRGPSGHRGSGHRSSGQGRTYQSAKREHYRQGPDTNDDDSRFGVRDNNVEQTRNKTSILSLHKGYYVPGGVHWKGDYTNMESCMTKCEQTPSCFGGDWNAKLRMCYFHFFYTICPAQQGAELMPKAEVTHFKRIPCYPPKTMNGFVSPGLQVIPGTVNIKGVSDLKTCLRMCLYAGKGIVGNSQGQICHGVNFDFYNNQCQHVVRTICNSHDTSLNLSLFSGGDFKTNPTVVWITLCPA